MKDKYIFHEQSLSASFVREIKRKTVELEHRVSSRRLAECLRDHRLTFRRLTFEGRDSGQTIIASWIFQTREVRNLQRRQLGGNFSLIQHTVFIGQASTPIGQDKGNHEKDRESWHLLNESCQLVFFRIPATLIYGI